MTTPRLLTLTDGGIETTLIFHQGIALREFAAFELLSNEAGTEALAAYYTPYLRITSYNVCYTKLLRKIDRDMAPAYVSAHAMS